MTPAQAAVAQAAEAASIALGWEWRVITTMARAWRADDPDIGKWLSRGMATVNYQTYGKTFEVYFAYDSAPHTPQEILAILHGVVLLKQRVSQKKS